MLHLRIQGPLRTGCCARLQEDGCRQIRLEPCRHGKALAKKEEMQRDRTLRTFRLAVIGDRCKWEYGYPGTRLRQEKSVMRGGTLAAGDRQ